MLKIENEYATLVDLCVCWGNAVPEYDSYVNDHSEYIKHFITRWNKPRLLEQQQIFFDLLEAYGVSLHFLEINRAVPWQMYTRDTGFVVGDKLFYCADRGLPERRGEIDITLKSLPLIAGDDVVEITEGTIEGGDVLVADGMVYVGLGSRTTPNAAEQLSEYVEVMTLDLGPQVMHLDVRMTILPQEKLLIYAPAFTDQALRHLRGRFDLIEVTEQECQALATNVFVINPETIVIDTRQTRIRKILTDFGFRVEVVDYSEPIAIAGSFRCTTLPLVRA